MQSFDHITQISKPAHFRIELVERFDTAKDELVADRENEITPYGACRVDYPQHDKKGRDGWPPLLVEKLQPVHLAPPFPDSVLPSLTDGTGFRLGKAGFSPHRPNVAAHSTTEQCVDHRSE